MRPRYLELEGLQSFREPQSIDFEHLSETGLFGIFGPTGSGKSTILDAITLALYGNVQRAARGTQGIINTASTVLKVSFTFDLQKKNGRECYRVERVYRRKKDSENSVEIKLARLFGIDGEETRIISDKPSEINNCIEELIGLKLDDFTRAVVLPQNKFSEFLQMEKAKKREMLERIFYLEEYGRHLGEKVSVRLAEQRSRLAAVQGAMSALGDASEKALDEAEQNMVQAELHRKKVAEQLKKLETEHAAVKEVWELTNQLQDAREKELLHRKELEDISVKRLRLENAIKADSLAGRIAGFRDTDRKLAGVMKQLKEITAGADEQKLHLETMKVKAEEERGIFEEEKPKLIERRVRLNNALELAVEQKELYSRLEALRNDYSKLKEQSTLKEKAAAGISNDMTLLEQEASDMKKELDSLKVDAGYRSRLMEGVRLEEDLGAAEAECRKKQEDYDRLAASLRLLEDDLQKLDGVGKQLAESCRQAEAETENHRKGRPGDRNSIISDMEEFHKLRAVVDTLKARYNDITSARDKKEQLEKSIEQLSDRYAQAAAERTRMETELQSLKKEEQRLKQEKEKNAASLLAEALRDGEACPVCGSLHHPKPASGKAAHEQQGLGDTDKVEETEKAAQLVIACENSLRSCEGLCIKYEEQLRGLKVQHEQLQKELAEKLSGTDAVQAALPEDFREIEPEHMDARLKAMEKSCSDKIRQLDEWEAALELLVKKAGGLSEQLNRHRADSERQKAELATNRKYLGQYGNELGKCIESCKNKEEAYLLFLGANGITGAKHEMQRILAGDSRSAELQSHLDSVTERLDALKKDADRIAQEKQVLTEQLAVRYEEGKGLRERKDRLDTQMEVLTGGADAGKAIKEVQVRLEYIQLREKQMTEELKAAEACLNSLNTQKNTLESQQVLLHTNFLTEKGNLFKELADKGFTGIEEAEACFVDKPEQDQLNREIKEYERVQRNIEAQCILLESRLKGRSVTAGEWEELDGSYRMKLAEKDESIAEHEGAKNIYNNIKAKYETWVKLNGEYTEQRRKSELLEQIQKLLKGNAFVEFIAEERLRYVAREATETLGLLTRHRYALELDADNGFVIRDNSNGGACRQVSTLSGGETFLTSLSLALALSKQIQLKGQSPLEFFFLDEGFGTLDGSLLDVVMDSLERLSSSERVIGIISHVPELKSRIQRRLIIDPPQGDGRGSRAYMEKA